MRTRHTRPRLVDRAEAKRPVGTAIPMVATALLVCVLCPPAARAAGGTSFLVDALDVASRVADTTVPFIENRGQVHPAVAFYARTFAGTVFVTHAGEIVYALSAAQEPDAPLLPRERSTVCFHTGSRGQDSAPEPVLALRETLVGANPQPIRGLRPSDTVVNVFKGNDPKRWQAGLRVFEAVDLGEVWPGVRLELVARGRNVEKRFTVAPGASPDVIRIQIEGGASSLRRERDGRLTVPSELGPVAFTRPVAFQKRDGRSVAVAYASRGDVYGFRVGPYDRSQPLVIDPLLASTLIGGSAGDTAYRVVAAAAGGIFIAGGSGSIDFPTTPGAFQEANPSRADGFVARFTPDLRRLRSSTFLGGDNLDAICGLGLDPAGNAVVAGRTDSTDFPTTPGAYDETSQRWDSFVSVLSPDLRRLVASTCVRREFGAMLIEDLAVDPDGSVVVAGTCSSLGAECPTTPGAYGTTPDGIYDAIVTRFSADLTTLIAGTLLATGNDFESAHRVALDPDGNVVVVGEWFYQDRDAVPRLQSPQADGRDGLGCVAKLDPDLTTVLGGRYLGDGEIRGLSIDADGAVWIAGRTWSWPITAGAFQPRCNNWYCGFVTKLAPDMETVLASTFLGGQSLADDVAVSQVVPDRAGGVFAVGYTGEEVFPTTPGAWSSTLASYNSGFVIRLDSGLSSLMASTLLGGRSSDLPLDAVVTADGTPVVTGVTVSRNYPTTPGAFDRVLEDGGKIFVSVFTPDLAADPQPCVHGGDLDFDGQTLMDDVQAAFYAVLGIYSPLPWEYCQADCNGDDRLTAGDTQAAFAKYLGLGGCADDAAP